MIQKIFILVLLPFIAQSEPLEPIYRKPSATYPSGNFSQKVLFQNTDQIVSKLWHKVRWGKDSAGWIRATLTVSETSLAQHVITRRGLPFRLTTHWNNAPIGQVEKGLKFELIKLEENWALIQNGKRSVWVESSGLRPAPLEWGDMITRQRTPLREKPFEDSKIVSNLKTGVQVEPLGIQGEFVKIKWNDKIRFVPFFALLTRLDFAHKVKVRGKWHPVHFTIGHWVKIANDEFVSVDRVQGLLGNQKRAYVITRYANVRFKPTRTSKTIEKLNQFYPVTIEKVQLAKWARATLKGHGPVWWQTSSEDLVDHSNQHRLDIRPNKAIDTALGELSTDELFGRKIFDMATSPKIPNLMFASADGVFQSLDGNSWKRVDQFGKKNYPLAFAPDGTIYVGPFRSEDHGQSFSRFIRWERVLSALQRQGVATGDQLRLKNIEVTDSKGKVLEMTLQVGSKQAQVTSFDRGHTWKPSKN